MYFYSNTESQYTSDYFHPLPLKEVFYCSWLEYELFLVFNGLWRLFSLLSGSSVLVSFPSLWRSELSCRWEMEITTDLWSIFYSLASCPMILCLVSPFFSTISAKTIAHCISPWTEAWKWSLVYKQILEPCWTFHVQESL